MSILTKVVRTLAGKSDAIAWPASWNEWLSGARSTDAGVSIGRDEAMSVAAFHACVRLIALKIASFPVDIYRKDGSRRLVEPTPPRWSRRPNAEQMWPEFAAQLAASCACHGEAFVRVETNGRGLPTDLFVVDPQAVVVARDSRTSALTYTVNTTAGVQPLTSVKHWRLMALPGSDRGVSPLSAARQELGISRAAQRYLASYFANGAAVSAVLQFPEGVTEAEAKAYVEQFRDLYTGAGSHHKVAGVVAAEYKPMAATNEQAQFLQLRSFSAIDIARFFNIHPTRVGEGLQTPMFGNSLEQFNMVIYQDAIQPYVSLFEAGFRELLTPPQYLKFNTAALLRGDTKTRMEAYRAQFGLGSIKPDEIRAYEDLEPLPDGRGQHTYVMTNLGPIGPDGVPVVAAKPGASNG